MKELDKIHYKEFILKEVVKFKRGTPLTKSKAIEGNIPVINGGVKPSFYHNESNREKNAITISRVGTAGQVLFWEMPIFVSDSCFTIETSNNEVLLQKYLYYFLNYKQNAIKNKQVGTVLKQVYPKDIENWKLLLPPIKKQKRIVQILDTFTQFSAELKAELKARVLQYDYYRDLLLSKKSLFNEYKLKDVVLFQKGSTSLKPEKGNKYPIVSGGVKESGWTNQSNRKENMITITSSGSAGYVAFWKTKIYALDCFTVESNNSNLNQKYLYHWFKNKQNDIYKLKTTGSISHVYSKDIENWIIKLPSLQLQEKIVHILDNFEMLCQDLNIGLPAELEARNKQYEYYRDKLLSFAEGTLSLDLEREREHLLKLIGFIVSDLTKSAINYSYSENEKLENYIQITKGVQLNKTEMIENDQYPVINGGTSPSGYYDQYNQDANQITIAQGGSVGYVDWMTTPFWASAHCYIVNSKDDNKLLNRYLYFVLKNNEKYLMEQKQGAGIPSLSKDVINNLKVWIPNLNIQKQIVNILNTFNELTNDLQNGLPAELEARNKQYEYYRDKLLSFAEGTLSLDLEREREREHLLTLIEILNLFIESINLNKNDYLTVKDLFIAKSGRIISKNELVKEGIYPVYSAQVTNNGEMGKLNTYDFDGEYLSWTIHGYAGEIFYRQGKFSATNVCGLLKKINSNVDIRFAYHYLRQVVPSYVIKKSGRQMFMTNEIYKVKFPIIPLYKQKEIAYKLDKFEKYINEVNGILPEKIKLIEKLYNYWKEKIL
ncbi:restriction endonuclease subunit S [Mycoplasmopsis columbina]|uniref:restriction endonuclease subunit S n=3 Tax=Mycoplasmopsis columbina TaxID=114881 RepID=UPI001004F227|nr:restriction endonuclease subunit S [Mycoplasmopsis columbina]VEU77199.1 restriction-modification enzyme subunit S1B [Mycoplasmopsis columbina]